MTGRAHPPSLLRKLAAALDAAGGPRPGEHLLVAISGGPDSTALLAGLAELAPARQLRLTAGHIEHGLRGAEGTEDRNRVAVLAQRLGVDFAWRDIAVAAGPNLEARARRARYRALVALAAETGATRIVTGHTQDDQVETVLLRLLRGAGRRGLGAIRPATGRLLRPLLAVTRADVRRFLADRDLEFAIDRTNAELRYARNRIRRLLVPFLEAEFNPQLGRALAALAARLRDEDDVLDAAAAARIPAFLVDGALRAAVTAEPPALARRIVRSWLERGNRRSVTAVHVERVLALAGGRARGAVAVPGPARVVREGDRLLRRRGREAMAIPLTASIAPGGCVVDPGGSWRLTLSRPRPRRPDELRAAGPARVVFDADALPPNLIVRSPRPGDRIQIAGVGTRKLQDILVDAKVPREARSGIPLLVGDHVVLWVAGVARSAQAPIGPGTSRVVEGVLEHSCIAAAETV
jgi:tRNA(Ile)-lysidine synthase